NFWCLITRSDGQSTRRSRVNGCEQWCCGMCSCHPSCCTTIFRVHSDCSLCRWDLCNNIVYSLAWKKDGISPITIILSGVAVNALAGGVIGYLSIIYSDRLPSAVQWMNGSLAAKG